MTPSDTVRAGRRTSELLAVAAGGTIGTLLRALLAEAAPIEPGAFPWPTFIANVVGAALLGAIAAHLRARPPAGSRGPAFLTAGLCGGITTFSALQLELVELVAVGHTTTAIGYATASLVVGLAALTAASRITERRTHGR